MERYAEISEDLASQASTLATQSEHLASLRDLLLPKLMTGQIDVASLDLNALVEGAVA